MKMVSVDAMIVSAGKLRYANNSNYKNDVMIRKEVILHSLIFHKHRERCGLKHCLSYWDGFPLVTCSTDADCGSISTTCFT